MIPLGLSHAEMGLLRDTLVSSHSIHVSVYVLNMEHERLSDVSGRLLGGQVDIDGSAEVTRSASVQLLDVGRTLSFDSDSPAEAAIYMDRMLRIIYSVKVPTVGWVDIPLFTGPISSVSRSDDVVSVECQGKESLAFGSAWKPMTFRKGHKKVDVIHDILADRAGENRFSFPDYRARLGKDLSITRTSVPWKAARRVASGMDKQLFYDGRGVARLRTTPKNPVWHFEHGNGGSVLNEPAISYTIDDFTNIVWVKGGVPKKQKLPMSYWFAAPRSSPLSPERLGRNGVPRYMLEVVEDSHVTTKAEAKSVAETKLSDALLETVEVSFDALPVPFLEPGDLVLVSTAEFATQFRVVQCSIPLHVGDVMTIGYNRRLAIPRRNGTSGGGSLRSGSFVTPGARKAAKKAAAKKKRKRPPTKKKAAKKRRHPAKKKHRAAKKAPARRKPRKVARKRKRKH